jgi:hypothetical protein
MHGLAPSDKNFDKIGMLHRTRFPLTVVPRKSSRRRRRVSNVDPTPGLGVHSGWNRHSRAKLVTKSAVNGLLAVCSVRLSMLRLNMRSVNASAYFAQSFQDFFSRSMCTRSGNDVE